MNKKNKSVLGKGLNSMLGGGGLGSLATDFAPTTDGGNKIASLPLVDIIPNPEQPRRSFDHEALEELASSIKNLGLVQPITVRPTGGGKYLIISGERRYRASQLAGLTSMPVYIREIAEDAVLELALVENIQRENLNAIEIALAYQGLIEQSGATHEAVAERVGKKRSSVSNYLRLLRLPSEIQLGLSERKLELGHARALLAVEDPERQMELYNLTVREQLSVREVEEIARAIREGQAPEAPAKLTSQQPTLRNTSYDSLEQHLAKVFGVKVRFKYGNKGKGSINIPFTSEEEMERLISLLQKIQA